MELAPWAPDREPAEDSVTVLRTKTKMSTSKLKGSVKDEAKV